jgi:hypothetical protein
MVSQVKLFLLGLGVLVDLVAVAVGAEIQEVLVGRESSTYTGDNL